VEAIAVCPISPMPAGGVILIAARERAFSSRPTAASVARNELPARDMGTNHIQLALSPDNANSQTICGSGRASVPLKQRRSRLANSFIGLGSSFPRRRWQSRQNSPATHSALGGSVRAPRVMRSTDEGQTWVASSGLGPSNGVIALAFVPGNGRVHMRGRRSRLYRSGDAGAT